MLAGTVALMRNVQNLSAGRRESHGADKAGDKTWDRHVEGACGELAAAKCLGLFWTGAVGNLRATDVGPYQVRTRAKYHNDLILHESDANDQAFILVAGHAPTYRVVGWILGQDGKRAEYWGDPAGGRPAFFVPQAVLHPMTTLRSAAA